MGPGSEALQGRPEGLLDTREALGSHVEAALGSQRGGDGEHQLERTRQGHHWEVAPLIENCGPHLDTGIPSWRDSRSVLWPVRAPGPFAALEVDVVT